MSRLTFALSCALAVSACAAIPTPLPTHLDPSNPDAPEGHQASVPRALSANPLASRESHAGHANASRAPVYSCPHHPEVQSDQPGTCPKCHMALELQTPEAVYACPHHPEVQSSQPGTCPRCHMALELQTPEAVYACPHHPEVQSNQPGTCPKCHMALELQTSGAQVAAYVCPHHPEVVSDQPGTCPKCHMALEPVTPATGARETGSDGSHAQPHHGGGK